MRLYICDSLRFFACVCPHHPWMKRKKRADGGEGAAQRDGHTWAEQSISRNATIDMSPLAELAQLLGGDVPRVGTCLAPPADFEIFTPDHEDRLLREPWLSEGAPSCKARPCIFGRRCVAMQPCMRGHAESGGVVLTEVMSPTELDEFERSGAAPAVRRPCVLCTRANVMDAYTRLRQSRTGRTWQPPGYALNWYANPSGGAGAYAAESCIPFAEDGDAWIGIFGSVCAFLPAKMRLTQDPTSRQWRIDQSELRHHFECDVAEAGPSTVVDDTLRRFLRSRPDVWDGAALVSPLQAECAEELLADVRRRWARFCQLEAAYGMAAGPAVARSIAVAADTCAAIADALAQGVPPVDAIRTKPRCTCSPPGLPMHIMAAASAGGQNVRTRRKRVVDDGGVAAAMLVVMRAAVEGGSARSVNEAITRACHDGGSTELLASILARSLMGGYESCVRRPPSVVRARVGATASAAVLAAFTGVPNDSPMAASAIVEHVAAMEDASAIRMADLCGGRNRWDARVERARLVMETLRTMLDGHWAEGASLRDTLATAAMGDWMRRAYRKTVSGAAAPITAQQHPWHHAEAALGADIHAEDATVLTAVAAGCTLAEAMSGLSSDAAMACIAGDISALSEAEKRGACRAVRTAQCLRRLRPVQLCTRSYGPDMCRDVVVCLGCFAVKNFINLRSDESKSASACGFKDMMPPNRLFDSQEPRCTVKPTCATAPLFRMRLAAFTGALLSDDKAIVVSSCCGLCCTTAALVPCLDGVWRCVACV